jgi:hypothetical protein
MHCHVGQAHRLHASHRAHHRQLEKHSPQTAADYHDAGSKPQYRSAILHSMLQLRVETTRPRQNHGAKTHSSDQNEKAGKGKDAGERITNRRRVAAVPRVSGTSGRTVIWFLGGR